MGGAVSCIIPEVLYPSVQPYQDTWKELVNVFEARKAYIIEGTLREDCSEDEVELRVLLNDSTGFYNLERFASKCKSDHDRKLLKQWKQLTTRMKGLGEDSRLIDKLIGSVSESIVDAKKQKQANAVAQLRKDMRSCFDDIFGKLFVDFRLSIEYLIMCEQLNQVNCVCSEDFDYFTKLGAGSFGCVFSCRKRSTGVMYAMKVQPKISLLHNTRGKPEDAMMELLASTGCPSPFVAQAQYAFQTAKLVFLALPLYAGGDMRRALNMSYGGHFTLERTQFFAAELASVLIFLHSNGLMHRDLKPENVFIDGAGHLVLGDLGSIADEKGRLQPVSMYNEPHFDLTGATSEFTQSSGRAIRNNSSIMKSGSVMPIFSQVNSLSQHEAAVTSTHIIPTDNSMIKHGNTFSAYNFSVASPPQGPSMHQVAPTSTHQPVGSMRQPTANSRHCPVSRASSHHQPAAGSASDFSAIPGSVSSYQCSYAFESKANGVVGTMRYMAPEVLALFADQHGLTKIRGCTPALDWFSYGVMVHEMLTGKCPYNASRSMTYAKLAQVYPIVLRNCDYDVDAVHKTIMGPFLPDTTGLLTDESLSFIAALVELNPDVRLGLNKCCFPVEGADVYSDIKSDPFFKGIDWAAVAERRMAPVVDDTCQHISVNTDKPRTVEYMLDRVKKAHWCENIPDDAPPSLIAAAERLNIKPEKQQYFSDWRFVNSSVVAEERAKEFTQYHFGA